MGNTNESTYCSIPDWKIPLTPLGQEQAREAGRKIKALIGDRAPIAIYSSPYIRTKQTLALIMKELSDHPVMSIREEPRLTGRQPSGVYVTT